MKHVWGTGEVHTGFWWGNLKETDPLGRPKLRWEDSIMMDLQEVGWGVMDWIDLAQEKDRRCGLVNAVMNLRVP